MDIAEFKEHWLSSHARHERGFLYDLCCLAGVSWRRDFDTLRGTRAEVSGRLGLFVYVDPDQEFSESVGHAERLSSTLTLPPPKTLISDLSRLWLWDRTTHGPATETVLLGDLEQAHLDRWFEPLPSPLPAGFDIVKPSVSSVSSVPNRLGRPVPPAAIADLQQANQVASQIRGRRDPRCPSARAAIRSAEILVDLLTRGYSTAEISEASGMKSSQITARLKLVTKLSVHQLRKQAFANK